MTDFAELVASYVSQIRQQQTPSGPIWPVSSKRITQGSHSGHVAWDIAATTGEPVRAVLSGVIEKVIPMEQSGYGNLVIEKLPTGERIYYAHNSAFAVREGQRVQAGQIIAAAGSTGRSTGSHVHLEIRDPEGRKIDPGVFFSEKEFSLAPGGAQIIYEPVSGSVTTEGLRRSYPVAYDEISEPTSISPSLVEGTTILQSPLGDISLAPLPWWNIAAVGAGAILVLIGILTIAKPSPERILSKLAPAAKIAATAAL